MKFTMPETLDGLSLEQLEKLYAAAFEEYAGLAAKDDADVTDGDIADIDVLAQHLASIEAAQDTANAAIAERADKLAAARSKVAEASAPADDPDADGEDDEGDDEGDEPDEASDEPDVAEAEQEKELVTASAARKRTVAKAASMSPAPRDVIPVAKGATLIAAANLPSIDSGHAFKDLREASQVWGNFASKGAGGTSTPMMNYADTQMVDPQALSKTKQQLGFMRIQKPENAFGITDRMSVQEQLDVIDAAGNERTRFGSEGLAKRSVLAAAAWCAPSETVYDFCSYETVSGILDIPTINLPRGGIKYSKGPDYATLAATWGFLQTEAQVEAATVKTCYPVVCPPFLEARLDAVGFCITAGVLTNAAFPELIRRVLEIGAVAHAHKVNSYVINKISTAIGAAVNWAEIGATTSDLLDAVDLSALRIRYQLAMAENATIEVVLPIWAKAIFRSDLSRRTGIDLLAVTDADINRYFAARGVRVQWVYDYQPLDATNTTAATIPWSSFPDLLEFMAYPAGAFVKGGLPVIDLDTIYDSVGLSTNSYTAAFFEEGVQVFNRCGFGVKVSVDVSKLSGRTGAHDITP